MEILTFLIVVTIIYSVILFFDMMFKSCMHYPYDAFLRGTGLTVKFMRLHWYTTGFNRTIVKWTNSNSKLLYIIYDFGIYISLILMPIGLCILGFSAIHSDAKEENVSGSTGTAIESVKYVKVELLLPGFNLPIDEIVYYIFALGISSIIHEMGHALAAVLEDVPVLGFGLYIWFIIPIAYTELGPEALNSLKMWKRLRVLCGGICHNIVLAGIGYLLFSITPMLLQPFYEQNSSIIVTNVKENSPVYGVRGIQVNDVIAEINNCKVHDTDSWLSCLFSTIQTQPAYCLTTDFVHQNDESVQITRKNDGVVECCDSRNLATVCFEYISDYGELEVPQHMCLNIRKTIEHAAHYCHQDGKCGESYFCIKPQMNNATTIIHLKRNSEDMIYMGHPYDIVSSVKISSFVPKTNIFSPNFADAVCLVLKYTVVFSLGLALINVTPCFGFDGQHIISTILNQGIGKNFPKKQRELLSLVITVLGTLLLFISLIKTIWLSLIIPFLK